jgi:hypothetical protein
MFPIDYAIIKEIIPEDVLTEIGNIVERHMSSSANLLALSPLGEEEIVWHYTSVPGFKSIIENQELWLTHSQFLNDKSEFAQVKTYETEIAQFAQIKEEQINEFRKIESNFFVPHTSDNEPPTYRKLRMLGASINSLLSYQTNQSLYTASFCSNGDLLSMWRSYGEAQTIAIGFSAAKIAKLNSTPGYRFGKCNYISASTSDHPIAFPDDAQKKLIFDAIATVVKDKILIPHLGTHSEISAEHIDFLNNYLTQAISIHFVIIFFGQQLLFRKNASFSEEEECRIIASGSMHGWPDKLHFRGSSERFIPYIKLPLKSDLDYLQPFGPHPLNGRKPLWDLIMKINVGPSIDQELNKYAIEQFLHSNHIAITANGPRIVDVQLSNIPLRR